MANQKVSEKQEIFAPKPTDLLYIIQDSVGSNIKVSNFFGNITDALLTGSLQLDTVEHVLPNGGALSDNHIVTAITTDTVDREFFLSTGTLDSPLPNFMLKVVYLKSQFGGYAYIKGGLIPEIDNVLLTNVGDAAIFMSTPAGWICLGGTSIVTRV